MTTLEALSKDLLQLPEWELVSKSEPIAIEGPLYLKENGNVVDKFYIKVELSSEHPMEPPKVYETGGRIERSSDRHIEDDGAACLFVEDEKRKYWNENTSILDFINGPIRSFFIAQSYFELTGDWIFGERPHGFLGVLDFYFEKTGIRDLKALEDFLRLVANENIKKNWFCPCKNGNKLKNCHWETLLEIRESVGMSRIKSVLEDLRIYRRAIKNKG